MLAPVTRIMGRIIEDVELITIPGVLGRVCYLLPANIIPVDLLYEYNGTRALKCGQVAHC